MDFNEYQKLSERTMPDEGFNADMANYALGAVGEAAEVSDEIKKVVFHGHDLDKDKIEKEIGDTLHYLAGIATLIEVPLEEIAIGNLEKLQGKGGRYEHGFSHEASRNRAK